MATPVSIAGYSPSAEAVTRDVHPSAQSAEGRSNQIEDSIAPAGAAASKNTQEIQPRVLTAHARQLITLDELAASIVREVIQPLTVLVLEGETCKRLLDLAEPPLDKVKANVAAILSNAQWMGNVVHRLRALFVKGGTQKVELSLNEIIERSVGLIEPEALRNDVSLRMDLSPDLPSVLGDSIQLQQVIMNLLDNGLHAIRSINDRPRELLVRSQRLDLNQAGIMVRDNGTGIDPDDMDRMFNTFFTKRVDGTGIGLAICRWIVEAHGGLIWASSDRGRGAAFYFALPGVGPETA